MLHGAEIGAPSLELTGWWRRWGRPTEASSGQTKTKQKKKRSHNFFHHRVKRGIDGVCMLHINDLVAGFACNWVRRYTVSYHHVNRQPPTKLSWRSADISDAAARIPNLQ